jgi:hypothetical protein
LAGAPNIVRIENIEIKNQMEIEDPFFSSFLLKLKRKRNRLGGDSER